MNVIGKTNDPMMKPDRETKEDNCPSPSPNLYINNIASTNRSLNGTMIEGEMPKERTELFPDVLDALQEVDVPPRVNDILSMLLISIHDLNVRVATLEMQASKRALSTNRLDWNDLLALAEFRITEQKGRILQKDLQKNLGIKSRTTMTYLKNRLVDTGRYRVWRRGRNNIIEGKI